MIILALNTAQAACDLALMADGEVLAERYEEMARGADGRLPGLVDEIMDAANLNLTDLDKIAVVTGPGSFTGIRIGVAFARGLALALDVPAVGLTSLEAGLAPDIIGPARVGLAAQKRPPDKTWWTQELQEGVGVTPVIEVAEHSFDMQDIEIGQPRALWAGIKAAALSADTHPPRPAYARAPEIHAPKPKP